MKSARSASSAPVCPSTSTCPVEVKDPLSDKPNEKKMFNELRDVLVKVIPFLLVMWMLTGSIYPAIDMTAGEKERGTMETLLIGPAERDRDRARQVPRGGRDRLRHRRLERAAHGGRGRDRAGLLPAAPLLSLPGLAACVLAALPIAMLIAACGLALGVFARSTKEGNYYMVPMFFVALPLSYWSMTPGMELDGFTSGCRWPMRCSFNSA